MVLWTMLVHGFGSILGRFVAMLCFFCCELSYQFLDKLRQILEIFDFLPPRYAVILTLFSAILGILPLGPSPNPYR